MGDNGVAHHPNEREHMPRTRKSGDGGLYYVAARNLWVAKFDNGTKPDGSRNQVTVTSRSQSVARAKMQAKKDEIRENNGNPYGNQTVAEWGEYWLEHDEAWAVACVPFEHDDMDPAGDR